MSVLIKFLIVVLLLGNLAMMRYRKVAAGGWQPISTQRQSEAE